MSIFVRWFVANVVGMTIGLGSHSFLAHGFTGLHGNTDDPRPVDCPHRLLRLGSSDHLCLSAQVRAGVVSIRGSASHSRKRLGDFGFSRRVVSGRNPFDILTAFLAFGLSLGLALRNRTKQAVLALAAATAGAGIITVGSGLPIAGKLMKAFGGGLAGDTTLWTYIGVVGGVSSGLLGSFALRRIIANDSVAKVKVTAG